MLQRLIVQGYKSLAKVDVRLGSLNFLIGTNASGKSNLLDALRVIQGIGYGFTVSEIFDGKPKSASSVIWDGIRGGSLEALERLPEITEDQTSKPSNACRFLIRMRLDERTYIYTIRLNPRNGRVIGEGLTVGHTPIYQSIETVETAPFNIAKVFTGRQGRPSEHTFEKHRPLLHQIAQSDYLPETRRELLEGFIGALSNQQQLDLDPDILRQYSQPQYAERIGEKGENFAALVQSLLKDESERETYESWLRELTPAEVEHVVIKKGALGEPLFGLKEGGREFAAPSLSDGTLRFAAFTAALFQPDPPRLMLLEEVENGIHPTRLRLLVELLRSRTNPNSLQVISTTHSPLLLAWLKPEEYPHTYLCLRGRDGTSVVKPVNQVPGFVDAVKLTPFSDLFAEGWLETTE